MLNEQGSVSTVNMIMALCLVSLGIFMLNYKKDK